jgi:hypothetical protein
VDIVASGSTFQALVEEWRDWAAIEGTPWVQLRRKLRIVGITLRTKTSPKTWRWQQQAPWPTLLPHRSLRSVSAADWFCYHLASSPKASRTFPPDEWSNPELARAPHYGEVFQGLREALSWYESGRSGIFRERLAAELMRTPGVKSAWVRTLAHELRAKASDDDGYWAVPNERPAAIPMAERQERAALRRAVSGKPRAVRSAKSVSAEASETPETSVTPADEPTDQPR